MSCVYSIIHFHIKKPQTKKTPNKQKKEDHPETLFQFYLNLL